jgi:hypothetical protein
VAGFNLRAKCCTRLETIASDKRSSLFDLVIADEAKKFHNIDTSDFKSFMIINHNRKERFSL